MSNSIVRRLETTIQTSLELGSRTNHVSPVDKPNTAMTPEHAQNRFRMRQSGAQRVGTSESRRTTSSLAIRTNLGFKNEEEQQDYFGGLLLSNLSFAS